MKHFHLLLSLLFFAPTIFAQIEWEALEAHNNAGLEIIHITKDNDFVAYMENPEHFLVSSDLGETWTHLYFDGVFPYISSYDPTVMKKHDGEYYLRSRDILYKYSFSSAEFEVYLDLDAYVYAIDDFDWLPNGNLIIGESGDISVFDSELNQVASTEWQSHSLKFIIGIDDVHYAVRSLGSSRSLVRFNADLSDVVTFDFGTIPFSATEKIIYNDGVFNLDDGYSTDGVFWIDYQYEGGSIDGPFSVNSDGDLYLVDSREIFKSTDKGVSFTKLGEIEVDGFWSPKVVHAIGDKLICSYETYCAPTRLMISDNGVDEWSEIDIPVGNPYAEKIEVVSNTNIFLSSCGRYDFFKTFNNAGWKEFDNSNTIWQCDEFNHLFSFPDGSIISDGICESTDEGITWEEKEGISPPYYSPGFIYKNDALYFIDYDVLFRSMDQGGTWEEIEMMESVYDDIYDVSVSEHIFSLGYLGASESVSKYSLDYQLISETQFPNFDPISIACSVNSDDVYILMESWNLPVRLEISNDDGLTYNTKVTSIPQDELGYESRLETDQFGNLYLLLQKTIYLSQDGGENWSDITPNNTDIIEIKDIDVAHDGHIYMATIGTPILKSRGPVSMPNNLSIIVYQDQDGNCEYSSNENTVPGLKVKVGDYFQRSTNQEGQIQLNLLSGSYDILADLRPDLYSSCNNDQSITFDGEGESQIIYIPLEILAECTDLSLGVTTPFIRRCFENEIVFEIENSGTETSENTELIVELDEFFEFVSCDFELISMNDNIYVFDVGDIAANGLIRGKLKYILSCDAEFGSAHYFNASLLFDNQCSTAIGVSRSSICQENIGSFDPNDMIGYINGVANKDVYMINDTLEYLIRFQNTGTDTAFTVRIEDLIGPEFDQTSIEPVSASHNYQWSIERNKLIVQFDDILLVDSLTNEEDSHGFVQFRISLKESELLPGEVFDNTAAIYFDFNDPIVTNTVDVYYLCKHVESQIDTTICEGQSYEGYTMTGTYSDLLTTDLMCDSLRTLNLIVLPLDNELCLSSIAEADQLDLNIYPVPASDMIYIKSDNQELVSYEILNLSGQSILAQRKLSEGKVDIHHLSNGIYFLKVTSSHGVKSTKKFIKTD